MFPSLQPSRPRASLFHEQLNSYINIITAPTATPTAQPHPPTTARNPQRPTAPTSRTSTTPSKTQIADRSHATQPYSASSPRTKLLRRGNTASRLLHE